MATTAEQPRERFTNFTPYEMKKGEEYMSAEMLQHFKDLLLQWKQELMEEVDRTMHHMQEDAANYADPSDRATQEEEFSRRLEARPTATLCIDCKTLAEIRERQTGI